MRPAPMSVACRALNKGAILHPGTSHQSRYFCQNRSLWNRRRL